MVAQERRGKGPRPTARDWWIASGVGAFVVAVALLGADRPPPAGFLAVVAMALSLVGLIAVALPRWRATKAVRECRSLRAPAVQGAVVGVSYWLVALALPFTGEPSIALAWSDYVLAAAVAASLGAAGAAVLSRLA